MRSVAFIFLLIPVWASAQIKRYSYHDAAKKSVKEMYHVKDTVHNILHGRYVTYFLNGNIESKGQFVNNETSGMWEFYYETGNIKMRGILRQNSNYGLWEYFYENGQKSMEGNIDNRMREGLWKIFYESGDLKESGNYRVNKRSGLWRTYFQDGALRGEIEYNEDYGRYTEYYHSGKVLAEGPKTGVRNVGHWRFFNEAGVLESEGDFAEGKRSGIWKHYYPSGKISIEGTYENDVPVGVWSYYFEDGTLSTRGEYVGGKKNGYWNSLAAGGKKKSEINYVLGTGEYLEYYPTGKLKVKGIIENEKNEGLWRYYSEDGRLEGECDFKNGTGTYRGYYASGALQCKGTIENDLRVGTWELYEEDGKLTGYYKPIYENNILINPTGNSVATQAKKTESRRGFTYFNPRYSEYRGVIFQGNPALTFVGMLPMAVEFYNEERLGHEFEFVAIRNPFFTADQNVAKDKVFARGYAFGVKQKFYNPLKTGMFYFAHEVRFTNLGYFANTDFPLVPGTTFTASASEQRAEYGLLLGVRLMHQNNGDGFTIDAFTGYGLGFRSVDVEPRFENIFSSVKQEKFVQTFRLGISFGYSMSFGGRR